jgi:AcrR family transcriptional regulator
MPPKFKFTKDAIIDAGLKMVRQKGWGALTARSLAEELGSSSKPIYSYFKSMEQLEEEIVRKAVDLLYQYMTHKRTGEPWIDHGIGYVLFAHEEKPLFRGIYDEKHIDFFKKYEDFIWKAMTDSLSDYPPFKGLSEDQIYLIQVTRWLFAQGLAFQVSNPPSNVWNDDKIVAMIQTGSKVIYDGLMMKFESKS